MNSCWSGNAFKKIISRLKLVKVKVHLQTHACSPQKNPNFSRCREPFLHFHTLLLCVPSHKPPVFARTEPGSDSLLCRTWNSSSVAISPSSRVAAASEMHDVLLFGLISLQLPGVSPTQPWPNDARVPCSARCAGACGRLYACRSPADDDLDPATCSACCLDKG